MLCRFQVQGRGENPHGEYGREQVEVSAPVQRPDDQVSTRRDRDALTYAPCRESRGSFPEGEAKRVPAHADPSITGKTRDRQTIRYPIPPRTFSHKRNLCVFGWTAPIKIDHRSIGTNKTQPPTPM